MLHIKYNEEKLEYTNIRKRWNLPSSDIPAGSLLGGLLCNRTHMKGPLRLSLQNCIVVYLLIRVCKLFATNKTISVKLHCNTAILLTIWCFSGMYVFVR